MEAPGRGECDAEALGGAVGRDWGEVAAPEPRPVSEPERLPKPPDW